VATKALQKNFAGRGGIRHSTSPSVTGGQTSRTEGKPAAAGPDFNAPNRATKLFQEGTIMNSNINRLFAASTKLAETAALCGLVAASLALSSTQTSAQTAKPFLPLPAPVVSTVPPNGDVNPYGVAFVPGDILTGGLLRAGDILVSNFNNSQNLQGTGTTIIRVPEHGAPSLFFQGKPGLGLTAALGVLRRGLVFVGNLPTADGTAATVQAGSLLVIDRNGKQVGALTDPNLVNGPWGMAVYDQGNTAQVFFSNVLNGTVTRLDLAISADGDSVAVRSAVRIASGYNHRTDPAALVLGPSGLFYDSRNDILYVASSADNAIYAVRDAGSRNNANDTTGTIVYQDNVHLHGPIDLTWRRTATSSWRTAMGRTSIRINRAS
jgi:hypothetical protein